MIKLDPHRPDDGATAVEYALMVGLIALVIVTAVTSIGLTVADGFKPLVDLFVSLGF